MTSETSDLSLAKNGENLEFSYELKKVGAREIRTREYLTESEIEKLLAVAKTMPRHAFRNRCLVLTMFRHGLRAGEAGLLRWDDVDLKLGKIHVKRLKNGNPSIHPIYGLELRLLKQLEKSKKSIYLFESERGGHLTGAGIKQVFYQLGNLANFNFLLHPHMMRHSCGYYLANKGYDTRMIQDWLGHRNIECTVIYTKLASNKFDGVFED